MRIGIKRSAVSDGARELTSTLQARGFNARRLLLQGSRFVPRQEDLVINWGDCGSSELGGLNVDTSQATNKLSCFHALAAAGVWIPEFTDDIHVANTWLSEGCTVVARQHLRGSSGSGVVIHDEATEEVIRAPLYTKYIKKSNEYRAHVFNGKVIDVQRKARNTDVPDEEVNWQVRTHANGFIYMRGDTESPVSLPDDIKEMCVASVEACGLDFGAVDLIHNGHYDKYYVLEINTAPGITGSTVGKYADAIEQYLEER